VHGYLPVSRQRRVAKLPAQQSDLASVQHLVPGTPEQCLQLRFGKGMGMRDGLIHFAFVQTAQFPKHLFVYSVKHGPEVRWAGILGGVGDRDRLISEEALLRLRDQSTVLGLRSSDAPQGQAVLGTRQVTDLPGDVTDARDRHPIPLGHGCLVKKLEGVVACEDDLLDA
jgi:hypothetical protein